MDRKHNLFLRGVDLLIAIKTARPNERYGLKLAKKANLGYARVAQLLNSFKEMKLIDFVKFNERTKNVKLTNKGEKFVDNLIFIKQTFE